MSIDQDAQKDLSLDVESAENIAGGTRKAKQTTRHAAASQASSTNATSAGLGMGPDPSYPNADGSDEEC